MYKLLIPFSGLFHWFLATFLVLSLIGCIPSRPQPKPPAEVLAAYEVKKMNDNLKKTDDNQQQIDLHKLLMKM